MSALVGSPFPHPQGCCEASNPVTGGHLWAGKHPWHLDTRGIWMQGWVLGQVSQLAAPWESKSPTITMGEIGGPLLARVAGHSAGLSIWGAGWWLWQAAGVRSQPPSQACWATSVEFLNVSVAKLLPYQSGRISSEPIGKLYLKQPVCWEASLGGARRGWPQRTCLWTEERQGRVIPAEEGWTSPLWVSILGETSSLS